MKKVVIVGLALCMSIGGPAWAQFVGDADTESASESASEEVSESETEEAEVSADEGAGYPISLADRPLTISAGSLNADVNFNAKPLYAAFLGDRRDVWTLGAAYGVMDDLEVRAALPLSFGILGGDASVDLGVGAVYRFMKGSMEMGAALSVQIPFMTNFELSAGVPVLFHIGGTMRIRTGVMLTLIDMPMFMATGINVPAIVDVSWLENLPISLVTGFHLLHLEGGGFVVPLGAEAGWTFGDGAPVVDLLGTFSFPSFLSNDAVTVSNWTLGLKARFYIL